ncbi:MAG: hypothetical protein ACTSXH_18170 [Promethearchaeota archaeon]
MHEMLMAIFQILIGIGFMGFWIMFYFTEYKSETRKMDEISFKHELSFPLPDLGWITPCLFIAAIGLLLVQKFGYFFSALAGAGMIFLGLIDFAFDYQNDVFKKKDFDTYMSVFIIALNLIFGPIFIIYAWMYL